MAVLDTVKQVGKTIAKGVFPLIDESNVDSQLNKSDLKYQKAENQTEAQKAYVALGRRRYERARTHNILHNEEGYTGLAYYNGNQCSYYDVEEGMKCFPQYDTNNPLHKFVFKQGNVIRRHVDLLTSLIMGQWPDAWCVPQTDSPQDMAASEIQDSINAHIRYDQKLSNLIGDTVNVAAKTTTAYIEYSWDKDKIETVGFQKMNPDGTPGLIDYHDAPVGGIRLNQLLWIDCYPDPNAAIRGKGIQDGAYFIKKHLMSCSDIFKKWKVWITPTHGDGTYGSLEQRLQWQAGDWGKSANNSKTHAEVSEIWEKPSAQYSKGRFWVQSGDTLIYAGDWPYESKMYPFVPIYIAKNTGSMQALNLTSDLLPIQRLINQCITKLSGSVDFNVPVLYSYDDAVINPNKLITKFFGAIINIKGARTGHQVPSRPEYQVPPSVVEETLAIIKWCIEFAEYITGLRDVAPQGEPPPELSGYAMELMSQVSKQRYQPLFNRVGEAICEIYQGCGDLYRQFGTQYDRLMAIDEQAIPQTGASSGLVKMQALKDGKCRVMLQPGSSISMLPGAKEEKLQEIMKLIGGGMPVPLVIFYLKKSMVIRYDKDTDDLISGLTVWQAQQDALKAPQPAMQIQTLKGQQALQLAQANQQGQMSLQEMQMHLDQVNSAIQVHADAQTNAARANADLVVAREQIQGNIQLAMLKAQYPTMAISLQAKPGVGGTLGVEELMRLPQTDNAAQLGKQLMPPIPSGGTNGTKPTAKK